VKVIKTYKLFQEITEELILLLRDLSTEQWLAPTCYPSWKVKDIVAHLIQSAIGRLSVQRDNFSLYDNSGPAPQFEDLSVMIDSFNTSWTDLLKSASPRILLDLISVTERQLADFILSQDLHSEALYAVGWAGETISENWFDLGREFTEHWHHQQQIREAVATAALSNKKYLSPVIQLFMYSTPFWYRDIEARDESSFNIEIIGESGGRWSLQRINSGWALNDKFTESELYITMREDTAWRFFTRSNPVESFRNKIEMSEDNELLRNFMNVKAIMIND
jgi:Mycothiol maleylpyruvate isomerase N-terminal domain